MVPVAATCTAPPSAPAPAPEPEPEPAPAPCAASLTAARSPGAPLTDKLGPSVEGDGPSTLGTFEARPSCLSSPPPPPSPPMALPPVLLPPVLLPPREPSEELNIRSVCCWKVDGWSDCADGSGGSVDASIEAVGDLAQLSLELRSWPPSEIRAGLRVGLRVGLRLGLRVGLRLGLRERLGERAPPPLACG